MKKNADTLGKRVPNESSAPYAIPAADVNGKLSSGWGGSVNTLATLDSSAKVVENPANATATPTASKIPIADGSGKVDGWITTPIFNKAFESSEQTLTASTTVSVAHGLGTKPKLMQAVIICKTAELGYSIGDEVMAISRFEHFYGWVEIPAVYCDSTNMGFVINAAIVVFRKDTQAHAAITLANWKLILRAWA